VSEIVDRDVVPERPVKSRFRVKTAWRIILAIVVLGGIAAFFRWTHATKPAVQSAQVTADVPVVIGKASVRDVPIWFSGVGTVTPLNMVDVKVRVDGQLQSVAFKEGEEVAAGQVLAQIDPRPYQATLTQAEANRQKDLAQLANARQEVVRAHKLASAGAGTSQNLDAMEAQAAALQATVAADAAASDAARLNLDFTRIVSPIAGRVGMRQVDPGSIVHVTDTTGIVTVTQMAPISVLFSLPQDELEAVQEGQHNGQLSVAVDTRDGSRHIADGHLVFINSSVDQTNGEIQLKAVFDNPHRELWPGEFVSARVLVRTDRGATVVPAQAIMTGENGLYVYVMNLDHTVAARTVTVGATVDGFAEMRTGLRPGDVIVLDGQSRLAPGAHVTAVTTSSSQQLTPNG
jgi:membrane fusion protein, multidrug efflux system